MRHFLFVTFVAVTCSVPSTSPAAVTATTVSLAAPCVLHDFTPEQMTMQSSSVGRHCSNPGRAGSGLASRVIELVCLAQKTKEGKANIV